MKNVFIIFQIVFLLMVINCIQCSSNITNSTGQGIVLFKFDFHHVETPFIVCTWVLLASLAKIGFHHSEWISSTIPESCLLILLGLPIGFILRGLNVTNESGLVLSSDLFFYFLLPPIILDAGYFMPSQVFYLNIGTILLYAVLGTIFNTFAVGYSLYAVNSVSKVGLTALQALLFGSLISAVDPVAVLAVFEEVHVHEILYMLVFGESVLNDAASVVLYRTFESLIDNGTVDGAQIGLAIASFFVVSIGGTLIGIVFALLTSFITKFTQHVRVIEPVFVFLMAYMSYLSAEIFHFSGIMSILFCGIIMKPYVESNVSRKSHTTIKYFLKLLSSSCEAIIFMFLGVSLVHNEHEFHLSFVGLTLLFITIYRSLGVIILTGFANKCGRLTKVKKVEQFIMSYGGLRGAVAFCLAVLVKTHDEILKRTIITTTISVVIFTVFIQGTTIKKLVDVLGVKKAQKREKTMVETVNDRVLGYMVAGVEEIIGVHGHGFWRNILEWLNKKYLRNWLERNPDLLLDEDIVTVQRRIAFKHALSYAENPSMIMEREIGSATLEDLKRNPSFAMQMAMKAQDTMGNECGLIDFKALSADRGDLDDFCSEAFNPRSIGSLIPKAGKTRKRAYSKRKYTLDSLEEAETYEDSYLTLKKHVLASKGPSSSRSRERHFSHHRRHKHKHKHNKGRSKQPDMDTLPELTENDETILDLRAASGVKLPGRSSENHLTIPDSDYRNTTQSISNDRSATESDNSSDSEDNDDGDENGGGITFIASPDRRPLVVHYTQEVPGLPTFSENPYFSDYVDKPILDRVPKEFTQRDQEQLYEASRWRSFTLNSIEDSSAENLSTTVEIRDPWSEPLSPPLKSNLNESNEPARSTRERTYSAETGF